MFYNITFAPVGKAIDRFSVPPGSAVYGTHADNLAEAITRMNKSEVKNRWLVQSALPEGKTALLRELVSAEIPAYALKFSEK